MQYSSLLVSASDKAALHCDGCGDDRHGLNSKAPGVTRKITQPACVVDPHPLGQVDSYATAGLQDFT